MHLCPRKHDVGSLGIELDLLGEKLGSNGTAWNYTIKLLLKRYENLELHCKNILTYKEQKFDHKKVTWVVLCTKKTFYQNHSEKRVYDQRVL